MFFMVLPKPALTHTPYGYIFAGGEQSKKPQVDQKIYTLYPQMKKFFLANWRLFV
jgi:hypothetical protein